LADPGRNQLPPVKGKRPDAAVAPVPAQRAGRRATIKVMETAEYDLMFAIEMDYWWHVGKRWFVLKILRRWLNPPPGIAILDIGCGTGANMKALGAFGTATGSDISESAVGYCRARGLADAHQQTDPGKLPFPDGSFDLVTALDVLEHVDDDLGLLHEVGRVLKPGGTFLMTAPAYPALWSVHDESLHHKRRYGKKGLLGLLGRAGLGPVRLTHLNGFLLPAIVPVRWLRDRLTRKRGPTSDFNLDLPGWLNAAFLLAFKAEWMLVRFAPLPFGLTICCMARKEG